MPRQYVDNAMNRSLGRVGMDHGTAVFSRSSGGGGGGYSSQSSSGYYVDNSYNRSVGRVGMEHGSHVVSRSSTSSRQSGGGDGLYVDNAFNRSVGRVGLEYGSHVVSRSSTSSRQSSGGDGCYVDNAFNRSVGRVNMPYGSCTASKSSGSASTKVYVDNALNRKLGRVGLTWGSMPHSTKYGNQKAQIFEPIRNADYNRGNDVILEKLLEMFADQKNEYACTDLEKKRQCEEAEGVLRRRKAEVTKKSRPLKDSIRSGEEIDFTELKLGEKIGGGGFGDVHRAKWNDRDVAVKKLRVMRVSQKRKQEFAREVKMFSSLRHACIVQFFGACIEPPNLAIVMEYMPEGSLSDIIHIEAIQLKDRQKNQMMKDCLSALTYLHSEKVAHRDIKCHNIMVCEGHNNCKLADFGLALKDDCDASSSVADFGAGTVRYSPPEVLNGVHLDTEGFFAADVYSLAISFTELLSEDQPFDGYNVHQVRNAILSGERPPLKEAGVAGELISLLSKCMSESPRNRPSASAFLKGYESGAFFS